MVCVCVCECECVSCVKVTKHSRSLRLEHTCVSSPHFNTFAACRRGRRRSRGQHGGRGGEHAALVGRGSHRRAQQSAAEGLLD